MYTKDELLRRRAALSSTKREVLAQQLRGAAPAQSSPPTTIPMRPPGVPVPLSSIQERFWFLQQLDLTSVTYVNVHVYQLTQPLTGAAVIQAVRELMRRHEILRTTYHVREGQVFQQVDPTMHTTFSFPIIDLQHLPEAEHEAETLRLIGGIRARPLLPALAPPWSITMIRVRPNAQVLVLRVHHLIADGWSIDTIIRRELMALYYASLAGQPSPLPELPIQYADYAYWQRQQVAATAAAQLAYWTEHLAGAPEVLELPTDRPRPSVQYYREAIQHVHLDAALSAALRQLGQQAHASLFMTLLAAFAALMARMADQHDLVVGTSVAGRSVPELEPLLGCFINNLPLRIDQRDRPTFRELVRRVRTICLGAYAHQDLPLEQIVAALQPRRDLSRSLLFQVMFQIQNFPAFEVDLKPLQPTSDLSLVEEPSAAATGQGLCDLMMLLYDKEEITGELAYDATLFAPETIARMIEQFKTLLAAAVATPDVSIVALPLLSEAELRQLLVEWNATAAPYPQDAGIHELFELQAMQTPDAVAVVWNDRRLTYRALNARACQLARYLRRRAVGPGALVGICMERSIDAITAVLGVLKAGGAYVPLDPSYPQERLAFMLADSRAAVLLTHGSLQLGLDDRAIQTISLDSDQQHIACESDRNLDRPLLVGQPAYVIYTSGSTGRPKGVIVAHTSLVNIYQAWEAAYQLRTAARRHLQMASFSFDVFSGDLARALCSGGTLVLCPHDHLLLPHQLYDLMRAEQIDCAEFVPAVLRNLVATLEERGERLDFMRLLVCASDSWSLDEYARFRRICGPETRIINSFGVTEATIDSTYFEPASSAPASGQVPIGRPFANTEVYVLDGQLQLAPIGVIGELCLGGAGLACGYLGRPDLTAERFVPNPFQTPNDKRQTLNDEAASSAFSVQPLALGSRLYRTGDRARFSAAGVLEFYGRRDQQLKIRGQRLELGEVEAALRQHPQIAAAAVLADTRAPGGPVLVAYLVATNDQRPTTDDRPTDYQQGDKETRRQGDSNQATDNTRNPTPDTRNPTPEQRTMDDGQRTRELRAYLKERLPEYMLPARCVWLAALPLTPNGKLDRAALPAADGEAVTAAPYVAPSTLVEQELAALWSLVLGRADIGIYDSFFALGGHSLLAGQLLHRINSAFQVELPLRKLFEEPTIVELALAIEEAWITELESTPARSHDDQ
jgi:amino acid adenylation domain-containing protein